MGLITKEVEVCIVNNNYKYYEDLGYYIPKGVNKNGKEIIKSGTYIKVKTDDLPKDSHYKEMYCAIVVAINSQLDIHNIGKIQIEITENTFVRLQKLLLMINVLTQQM